MRGRVAAALLTVAVCGCGGGDGDGDGPGRPRLTVSAAQSLQAAFENYGERFEAADARFSFAGSDALAAQLRQGVKPDVYAAANTQLPLQLYDEGLVDRPVVFASNRLVLAVPAGSGIDGLSDLARDGTALVIGAETVPAGAYTRELLGRLPAQRRRAILANVRSAEPDVSGVVGKLTQGAADAGFLYVTDVLPVRDRVRAIDLPARLQPRVEYAAAVVREAGQPDAAQAFVDGLLAGAGSAALADAGFLPAPR